MLQKKILNDFVDKIINKAFDSYFARGSVMGISMALLGKGILKAESYPDAGHDYYAVLDSIYKYQRNNPGVDVKGIFENSLILAVTKFNSVEDFTMVINYIFTQLDNEKKNLTPFKVEMKKVLEAFKIVLNNCEDMSKKNILLNEVQKADRYLYENYGHRIL